MNGDEFEAGLAELRASAQAAAELAREARDEKQAAIHWRNCFKFHKMVKRAKIRKLLEEYLP